MEAPIRGIAAKYDCELVDVRESDGSQAPARAPQAVQPSGAEPPSK